MVRPTIIYGYVVWAHNLTFGQQTLLDQFQRLGSLESATQCVQHRLEDWKCSLEYYHSSLK
ncbi:Hypothetical protein FKW44_021490 [Caligus rogercresseyi]|uniref:Uncharacterized protein n=1 Tax=Caligus rogercresseyi TaxID=217165 RepID=A0A7T8JV60_CALRO|nr:Hypothetical protein FKW44_021490 [Caligus rogercresseyi]